MPALYNFINGNHADRNVAGYLHGGGHAVGTPNRSTVGQVKASRAN